MLFAFVISITEHLLAALQMIFLRIFSFIADNTSVYHITANGKKLDKNDCSDRNYWITYKKQHVCEVSKCAKIKVHDLYQYNMIRSKTVKIKHTWNSNAISRNVWHISKFSKKSESDSKILLHFSIIFHTILQWPHDCYIWYYCYSNCIFKQKKRVSFVLIIIWIRYFAHDFQQLQTNGLLLIRKRGKWYDFSLFYLLMWIIIING